MATKSVTRLTAEDYLDLDRAAEYRSEFVSGEMFAMSGGSPRHARLGIKIALQFEMQLQGKRCRAYSSDLRTLVSASGAYLYPDVSIVCGPIITKEGSDDICTNPALIVEVLSPSTAAYDRGLKFQLYRQILSLNDYLLVHCDDVFIEHYSRQPNEGWLLHEYRGPGARVPLPNLQCELALDAAYDGVMEEPG